MNTFRAKPRGPHRTSHRSRLALTGAVLIVLCLSSAAAAAQRWDGLVGVIFQNYGRDQGLPPVLPTALAQDRDGFLWIGTESGLVRWDGYRFLQYGPTTPGGAHGLPDGWIRALHVDPSGQLWIGTDADGLARYDRTLDRFIGEPLGPGPSRGQHIRAISDDGRGGLWVGADKGLYHLGAGRRSGPALLHDEHDSGALPGDQVQTLLLDRRSRLWVGTDKGLVRLDPGAHDFSRISMHERAGDAILVSALFEDETGRVWVGTTQHGLYLIAPDSLEATPFIPRDPTGWAPRTERISSIAAADAHHVWVAMRANGIVAIDVQTLKIRRIRHDQLIPNSLAHDDVWTLLRDRAGSMWVGGGGGLSYHPNDVATVSTVFGDTTSANGGADPDVASILGARNGRVWLGFLNGGVDIIDPSIGRVARLRADSSRPDTALPRDVVAAMAEGADGAVYIGTVRGLYRADESGRRLTLLRPGHRAPHAFVRTLLADGNTLWVGGPEGLWRVPIDVGAPRAGGAAEVTRLRGENVFTLLRDPADGLWIGTTDGLDRLDLASGSLETVAADAGSPSALPAPLVSTLLDDRQGRLWVGTFGGGIAVMVGRDRAGHPRFRRIGVAEGLPNLNVDKLLLDAGGLVWASTDGGLAVIDPATFKVRPVQRGDGALLTIYWANSGATDAWGEPLFGAKGGLSVVRPGWPAAWTQPAPVVISDVRIAGTPVPGGRFNGAGSTDTLVLRPGGDSLAVEFAALDYTAPEANRYAYRLDGFDRNWIEVDATRRIATYTNLPPGRYVLELRGSNRDGAWSAPPLKVPIHVLAAWHQTIWFRILLAVVALAVALIVISGIFRRRTAYLRRRQTELERHIAIRTAELQAANERLSQMATTDPLTGCATRRHFMERANGLIELGRRGLPTCLAIMDLDNFKSINDRHGHPIGDEVLRHAAQVFRAQLRASDLIGRIGGEEFAVMMPNTGAAEALVFVDRLRDALAKADFTVAGATVRTSVSVGLAEQRPLEDFAALYARADAALYTAKSRGRNRVVAADCAPSPAPADCSRCGSADCVCG